jgi:hypothetical protein
MDEDQPSPVPPERLLPTTVTFHANPVSSEALSPMN